MGISEYHSGCTHVKILGKFFPQSMEEGYSSHSVVHLLHGIRPIK